MPRRFVIAAAVFAIALLAALAICRMTRAPLVPTVSTRLAPLVRTLLFSVPVATASRVEPGTTLTGRVRAVAVAEGAQVKAGDVLMRLESDELRAALVESPASERPAAARLVGLRSPGRNAAQAGVAQGSRCGCPRSAHGRHAACPGDHPALASVPRAPEHHGHLTSA